MTREQPPPDLDWVTVRGKCSADSVFEQLRLMAKQNVDTRNAQAVDSAGFREVNHDFAVWSKQRKTSEGARLGADFSLRGQTIHVQTSREEFDVTLTLDDDGACKCRVGDRTLDPWQVLRMALEPVLFPG